MKPLPAPSVWSTLSLAIVLSACGEPSEDAHSEDAAHPVGSPAEPGYEAGTPSPPGWSGAPEAGGSPESGAPDASSPVSSPIDPADILVQAQADHPFSDDTGNKAWNTQCMNRYLKADHPELEGPGITGPGLPSGGGTLRFGKVIEGGVPALQFVTAPTDPTTSGRKRCELSGAHNAAYGEVHWIAFRVLIADWTDKVDAAEAHLFGTQMHAGGSADTSPFLSLAGYGNAPGKFHVTSSWQAKPGVQASWDVAGSIGTWKSPAFDVQFDQWMDFVIQLKTDVGSAPDPAPGDGFIRVWLNDDPSPIVSREGKVGYETGLDDYVKFGYYNWSNVFPTLGSASFRKVLMRSPILVRDNGKYTKDDLLGHVRAH